METVAIEMEKKEKRRDGKEAESRAFKHRDWIWKEGLFLM